MKKTQDIYRRVAVALGSIQYGVCSDSKALDDLATLLEEILDLMDTSRIIVIDHVDYVDSTKEDEYK